MELNPLRPRGLYVNAAVALVLTLCLGPLGAFLSWWLLGGVGLVQSLVRTLAYAVLFAFCFGLLFMLTLLLSAFSPLFAVPMLPLGLGIYLLLEIVLLISAAKAALYPEAQDE